MSATALDQAKKDEFGALAARILNDAAVAIMMSVGHRTGLFEAMAKLPPSTSQQIATAAGLNERYVREWLAAVVTGRIVEFESDDQTYILPPEHAQYLTNEVPTSNVASAAQTISVMCSVEDEIVECFRSGGGVPYSSYNRFPEVMRELSAPTFDNLLVDKLLPLAPGLVDSFGRGIDVLEVGCGSGRALNVMAKAFPNSRFVGYDFIQGQVDAARSEAETAGLSNVRFAGQDVAAMTEASAYDLVVAFDTVHDQARPSILLERVAAALRPGGTFLMWDVAASSHLGNNLDHPMGPFLYGISCMHCMSVSLAQGGDGLGAVWGEEKATAMLEAAGLTLQGVHRLPEDPANGCYISTRQRAETGRSPG